jgi:putative endonuclease
MVAGHLKRGQSGEEMARVFLRDQGYEILETNWRHHSGELDIICHKDDVLIFVEVKTKHDVRFGLPGEALTLKKQRRLIKTALAYLSAKKLWHIPCRFDLVAVCVNEKTCQLEHVPDAFEFPQSLGRRHSYWQPW